MTRTMSDKRNPQWDAGEPGSDRATRRHKGILDWVGATLRLVSVDVLTGLGSVLADRTRSSLLVVMMDGRAWTVTELAGFVGVARSAASEHLSRLLDAGFVSVVAQGRHRYFRLAGADVAGLVESLGGVGLPCTGATGRTADAPPDLRYARSCYDHLAGRLGVGIWDGLLAGGYLARGVDAVTITDEGEAVFSSLGIDLSGLRRSGRPLVRLCLDWTERRNHLAGALGRAVLQTLLEQGWVRRGHRPRSVLVTDAGHLGLHEWVGWTGALLAD